VQSSIIVGGVKVTKGHCGQQVVLENSTDQPVSIVAGNPREAAPSQKLVIKPGENAKFPVGNMTEVKVQVVKVTPVTTLDIIDMPEIGLMAGLLGVTLMDELVDEGVLEIVPNAK
jgi:hypothetical protein